MQCTFQTKHERIQNGRHEDSHVNVLTTLVTYPTIKIAKGTLLKQRSMGAQDRIFVYYHSHEDCLYDIRYYAVEGVPPGVQQSAARLFLIFLETPPWCDLPAELRVIMRAYLLRLSLLPFTAKMYKGFTRKKPVREFDQDIQRLLEQNAIFDSSIMQQTVLEIMHEGNTYAGLYLGSTRDTITLQCGANPEQKRSLPRAKITKVRVLTVPELITRYDELQRSLQRDNVR